MPNAVADIIAEIHTAFPAKTDAAFAPLVNSEQGDEPALIALAFADKLDWTELHPEWLDSVPQGLATALSFLSDTAICFYIAAYMVADLNGALRSAEPIYHLTHGFTKFSIDRRIWPRSAETWTDYSRERWSHLTQTQATAIVHYLEWYAVADWVWSNDAKEALSAFWYDRASIG